MVHYLNMKIHCQREAMINPLVLSLVDESPSKTKVMIIGVGFKELERVNCL